MGKWRLRVFWALLLAAGTVWAARSYLTSLEETTPLVLTTREIPARAQITADMVKVVQVKKSDLARIASDAFESPNQVVGRYARRAIPSGEILRDRPSDLTTEEIRPATFAGEGTLADFLPPDTRAITVKMDAEGVLGEHVQRGDRVDLVFTSRSDSTGGVYASLVTQQVTVLSIDHNSDTPDEVLVTLLVSVEQAVVVSLAKRTGDLDMVLNPPDPSNPVQIKAISPLMFTGQAAPPPLPAQTEGAQKEEAPKTQSATALGR